MKKLSYTRHFKQKLNFIECFGKTISNGEKYEFLFPEQQVYQMTRHQNGETIPIREVKSQKLPFRIEGKGALGGYFAAYLPTDMEKTFQSAGKWQLVVQTSQKEKVFSIVADKPGYDIEQYGY